MVGWLTRGWPGRGRRRGARRRSSGSRACARRRVRWCGRSPARRCASGDGSTSGGIPGCPSAGKSSAKCIAELYSLAMLFRRGKLGADSAPPGRPVGMTDSKPTVAEGSEYVVFFDGGPSDGSTDTRISTDGSYDEQITDFVLIDGMETGIVYTATEAQDGRRAAPGALRARREGQRPRRRPGRPQRRPRQLTPAAPAATTHETAGGAGEVSPAPPRCARHDARAVHVRLLRSLPRGQGGRGRGGRARALPRRRRGRRRRQTGGAERRDVRSTPTIVITRDDGEVVFRSPGVPTLDRLLGALSLAI